MAKFIAEYLRPMLLDEFDVKDLEELIQDAIDTWKQQRPALEQDYRLNYGK